MLFFLQSRWSKKRIKMFNKEFKKDWENMSPGDKRHIIKMIILLASLTLIPVICIACSAATGAMWLNE